MKTVTHSIGILIRRMFAYFIDIFITFTSAFFAPYLILANSSYAHAYFFVPLAILSFFFPFIINYIFLPHTHSYTLGLVIVELRLVNDRGQKLGLFQAFIRFLVSVFSLLFFNIGNLWITKNPEGQAWHDIIAGTYIVEQ